MDKSEYRLIDTADGKYKIVVVGDTYFPFWAALPPTDQTLDLTLTEFRKKYSGVDKEVYEQLRYNDKGEITHE